MIHQPLSPDELHPQISSSWRLLVLCLVRLTLGFFRGSVLGQETSEPSLVLVKPRRDMNKVNCRLDMTEILLKEA